MIPDIPPEFGPGKGAEKALYEALQSQLTDDFFVYHGLRYLEKERAAEGEADFLILHREYGLLSVECKGRGVRRTGTGQWFRLCEDGKEWPLREDPFQQAQRTLKQLVKELDSRLREAMPRLNGPFPFTYGYAVAFPLTFLNDADLPLNLQLRIVFDASDMNRIEERVLDAFNFWGARSPAHCQLEKHEFSAFRKRVLHPRFHVTESLGAQLQLNTQQFIRLTEEQVLILKGILSNPRLTVSGGAGTGKTILALEAAKLLSERGMRVLLMCYNQALARYLDRIIKDWQGLEARVDVYTFHGLCRKAYEVLEIPFVVPTKGDPDGSVRFWNETAPLVLMEALDKGKLSCWEGIVIDEGQDFAADWWAVIEGCLANKETGTLVIFYDPHQEIFGRGCHIPELRANFPLLCNFRNTRMIIDAMRGIMNVDMAPHPRSPQGQEVKRHLQKSKKKAQEEIEGMLKTYIQGQGIRPEQIAIITPHTKENSLFSGTEDLAGYPLAEDPANRHGAILHTTIGKFKGMESDVVFFADIDPEDPRCNVNARYVAVSRGRQILHEFWKRPW
jgi:hypothetical protein